MGWPFLIDMCVISSLLLIAALLRSRILFFQKLMIPNNIVAGFCLLFIGNEFIGIVDIPSDRYGYYVYHLLAITYIAMSLRISDATSSRPIFATGLIMTIGYNIQALIGLLITFITILFFDPDLFPTFGHFLVLGFGQGPGQAFAIGKSWEPLGFSNAGSIGLTFAAIGYLWACIVGIFFIHRVKSADISFPVPEEERVGLIKDMDNQPEAGRLVTATSAMDGLTFQVALVGLVYLATYGFLTGVEHLFQVTIENESVFLQLKNTIWGVFFIFAAFMAILFKTLIVRFKCGYLLDNGLLTRVSGISIDFMVVAAIGAVSISVFRQYITLIMLITTFGGFITILLIIKIVRRSGMSHTNERIISIFGTLTGTLSTGLTLTRIMDPQFKTPVARDLIFGCGVTFPIAFPAILSFMVPLAGMTTPNPHYYYFGTIFFLGFYTICLYMLLQYVSRRFNKI